MFEAVLFDLDGVLIESRDAWYHVLVAAARAFGHPAMPRETFDANFGQGIEEDMKFFPGCSVAELEAYLEAHFLDHVDRVVVNADAAPVLQALAQRGAKTAIVTNTQTALAKETVRGAGLEPDLVIGANDVAHEKPAADMLLLACERLGVSPARAVMVGDSRFDREAALAAEVRFLGYGIDGNPRIERLTELLFLGES